MNFDTAIDRLINRAVEDYRDWNNRTGLNSEEQVDERTEEFREGFTTKNNPKYFKIMTNNGGSVWAFVANRDIPEKNLKYGDILKPASWSAPAAHARGNIFEDDYTVRWTGPLYL